MNEKLLTTDEIAAHYGVTRQAVHKWRKRDMPFQKVSDKTFRYKLSEVEQFFKNKAQVK